MGEDEWVPMGNPAKGSEKVLEAGAPTRAKTALLYTFCRLNTQSELIKEEIENQRTLPASLLAQKRFAQKRPGGRRCRCRCVVGLHPVIDGASPLGACDDRSPQTRLPFPVCIQ